MHVLHVTFSYKPAEFCGTAHCVRALAEGFARRGHRVTVFATDAGLPEDCAVPRDAPVLMDGVEVWYFHRHVPLWVHLPGIEHLTSSGGYMPAPALAPAMRDLIAGIDVVHTHVPYLRAANVAARMAIAAGKPLFYSPRGSFRPEMLRAGRLKKMLYLSLVAKPIMQHATAVVGLSDMEINSIQALGVCSPCHLISNGVDVERFRQIPGAHSLARFGFSRDQIVVLFLGRVRAEKGAELLFEAFVKIAAEHPSAVLVMAGTDEQQLTPRFRAYIQAHGLKDRVLLPGFVAGEEKLDLLARADLFVLPSRSEARSMAVLEALASGTPVLISPGCDFDVVAASGAGWVVELDCEQLAAALSRLLSNPQLLKDAGTCAYEFARRSLSWTPVLTRLEDVYAAAIAQASAPQSNARVRGAAQSGFGHR
jgi:glycosyltransferase involved in cell wall biosynthesis